MPRRTKNPSMGLAALEAYLNEPLRPGYVGGRRSGNLLINEYAANIPDTYEQEREGDVLDFQEDITRDYTGREIQRQAREAAAREAGFRSVADASEYERGMQQLKTMIPLQVGAMNAQARQAGVLANQQRYAQQQAAQSKREADRQARIDERQFKQSQERRAGAVEAGKTKVPGTGGLEGVLRQFLGPLIPGFDTSDELRQAAAQKIRSERYQPQRRAAVGTGSQEMAQAAQVLSQRYPDASPEEMLQLAGEDEFTPEEMQQFADAVGQIRGF